MLRQRSLWPITVRPHLGEGTRSRLPLTAGPKAWYVQILGTEPPIRHKGGNWGRRIIFRTAAEPIRESKSMGQLVFGPKRPAFVRSRNSSDLHRMQGLHHRLPVGRSPVE